MTNGRHTTAVLGAELERAIISQLPNMKVAVEVDSGQSVVGLACDQTFVKDAVPSRKREFILGRTCARRALQEFGITDAQLPQGADRAPRWPIGYTGSISHSGRHIAAAVASIDRHACMGLDLEASGGVKYDLWKMLFSEKEIAWLSTGPKTNKKEMATVMFSAKEAYYKAQHYARGRWLDFHDVDITLNNDNTFVVSDRTGSIEGLQVGAFTIVGGLVVTSIARKAP